MIAIHVLKLMGELGLRYRESEIAQAVDYTTRMIDNGRVILIWDDLSPIAVMFFSVTDTPDEFLKKGTWEFRSHDVNGKTVYVEKIISKTWNKELRIRFEEKILQKFPDFTQGVWHKWFLTVGAVTTPPTKATTIIYDNAFWRKTGNNIEIRYQYVHIDNTGAATGSGVYLYPIPSGLTMDTNLITPNTATARGPIVGHGWGQDASSVFQGSSKAYNSTNVIFSPFNNATATSDHSSTFIAWNSSNLYLMLYYQAPITGWD